MTLHRLCIFAPALLATAWLAGCGSNLTCGPESLRCANAGVTVCHEEVVRTCTLAEEGCLLWKYEEDCSDSGRICEQDSQGARCRPPCDPACDTEAAARCDGFRIQVCESTDRGCLEWTDSTDCAADGQNCVETAGGAVCEPFCIGDCSGAGDTRCSGSTILICQPGADDCLRWETGTACESPFPVCVDSHEPATCIGGECTLPLHCGARGDAVCLSGFCTRYSPATGYGSAVVDLSFARDLYESSPSGHIYFLLPETSDGRILTCEGILSGEVAHDDPTHNFLRTDPRLLVFHWENNQTYFPDNLVQFIRPAEGALVVAAGYRGTSGDGALMAIGCIQDVGIVRDQQIEVTVPLVAP